MTLRRVGVWSAARVACALYAAMGLLFGAGISLFARGGSLFGSGGQEAFGGFGVLFSSGAIVFLPILYGLMGLVVGAIGAALYNLIAGIIGGLELDLVGRP